MQMGSALSNYETEEVIEGKTELNLSLEVKSKDQAKDGKMGRARSTQRELHIGF
jgi:hypothetical protein